MRIGSPSRWRRSCASAVAAAVLAVVAVFAVVPSPASAVFDVDQARSKLAAFFDEHPPLPAGSDVPASGPPCPLAAPEQIGAVLGDARATIDPWFASPAFDAELRSDVGDRVAVVSCIAAPAPAGRIGVGLFALDIAPFDDAGLTFDRVARRFGVGRAVWVEPPGIGGDLAGACLSPDLGGSVCVALWHRDGLVIGLTLSGQPGESVLSSAASVLVNLVPIVTDTLIVGLPTTTTTSTTTSSSTTSTSTTTTSTTSTTTTTTLPPTTTSTSTSTSTSTTTTTEPPTTTTTTLPPTTTSTSTSTSTSTTTTTEPPTTTTSTTTTTEPPTTTTSTTTTTATTLPPTTTSTTTTTLPPTTTSTTTTTLPPTTTSTTTTTLPPTTTSTTTTTTLPPTTTTIPLVPLWERIDTDPELTMFADAVEAAGLIGLFDETVPVVDLINSLLPEPLAPAVADLITADGITVLVPTNTAITALANWADLLADPPALQRFVLSHVVAGQFGEEQIFSVTQLTALSGDVLNIDATTQTINGAHLVVIDQLATNGIAHTIDAVIVVPTLTPTTTIVAVTIPATAPPPP